MHHGYPGPGHPNNWRRGGAPHQQQIYVETGPYPNYMPNEVDPGMNGDGWQGPGGRGGGHHMNGGGGGRRGGGMHNQNRMQPNQHHGGMNRMMPPGFRHQPQQSQYMSPYPMGGMPGDMMELGMRMGDMSLSSTPTMPGQFGDMGPPGPPPGPPPPPQQGWNQPAPFGDDLYDPSFGGAGMPPHHVPFGQRGGGNQYGGNRMNNRQGGYQRGGGHQNGGYMPPMMVPPMGAGPNAPHQPPFFGNQQPQFGGSPFPMGGQMGGGGGGGGGHEPPMGGGGPPQNGFQITSSSMDDYSMWTDENDEDAKRKKILRDKGLLAWGDAEVSNNKPIRRWLVPEGHEEDFDTAMARCPSHLKKKTLNEEALRRRLGSENPAIVAQAQQQAEEEANATVKVGRRPIIPCGWGDLPLEMGGGGGIGGGDKSLDYDQGSSKGWDDAGSVNGGGLKQHHHPHHPHHLPPHGHLQQPPHDESGLSSASSPWNLPGMLGGPSSSETRNPFFAQHMQQQQQQQHHFSHGVYGDSGSEASSVWPSVMDGSVLPPQSGPTSSSTVPPLGMLSMASAAAAVMGGADEESSQKQLAESLKFAVEKGHLDIALLSLPHIPPNVLDLLTEILTVIPRLDGFEDTLKKLGDSRPANFEEKDDPESWMNKDQKNEHDKAVIGVVTSKIEVTQLAKKITEALIEAGLIPPPPSSSAGGSQSGSHHHHQGGPPPPGGSDGGTGASTSRDTFNSSAGGAGPPDHYYDYSFLG